MSQKLHLELRWTVSRARDTAGYNVCTLYADGKKVARCNGGGYDMEGTCLGTWIAKAYANRLLSLTADMMPEHSHWEPAEKPRRWCRNLQCRSLQDESLHNPVAPDVLTCPHCGEETEIDHNDGTRISDGRYFYGLTFHDPNYDPGKAKIGADCHDRTIGQRSEGKTVQEAEDAGESLGLERYQAFYSASSKTPTERHTIPLIDGACGKSSVEQIAKAIGLELEYVPTRSKKQTLYTVHDKRA